ncbi:MAG: hypothetical protein KAR06_03190 [Deltaproteobacteria bacterium]|nr:hypothetical protein [Deltaproteobacteria bacterium]
MRLFKIIIFAPVCVLLTSLVVWAVPDKSDTAGYVVTTFAGSGHKSHQDGAPGVASFNWPTGVTVLPDGRLFVADFSNNIIRSIDAGGNVMTVAGVPGIGALIDGKGKDARLHGPDNIDADSNGNIYIADADNYSIRVLSVDGTVRTIAGSGKSGLRDGIGKEAEFGYPTGVAVYNDELLYVADRRNNIIRRIEIKSGKVTTLAGNGIAGLADGFGVMAHFREPISLAVASDGSVYVADSGNHAIRRITPEGKVTTIAGGSGGGYKDGDAKEALFKWPTGIALDKDDKIFVCDSSNNKIRSITVDGQVGTVAGMIMPGSFEGQAIRSTFSFPTGIDVALNGDIYVADSGNNKIRLITRGN